MISSNILLEQWLIDNNQTKSSYLPDIVAIGFQEIDTSGGAYIYDDKKKEDEWEQVICRTIQSCYKKNQEETIEYKLLKAFGLPFANSKN